MSSRGTRFVNKKTGRVVLLKRKLTPGTIKANSMPSNEKVSQWLERSVASDPINTSKTTTKKRRLIIRKKKPAEPNQPSDNKPPPEKIVRKKWPASKQKSLNKQLVTALKRNRSAKMKELLLEGAALAYENYDAITEAAEENHMSIFQTLFDEMDFTALLDKQLVADCADAADEFGHNALRDYLLGKVDSVPEELEDENFEGCDD